MSAMPESAVAQAAEQTRLAFGLAVTAMAELDDTVVAISADTMDLIGLRGLAEKHPDRVIDVGIAEQNAMGIASGLATAGLRPFLCGYAPFITARSSLALMRSRGVTHLVRAMTTVSIRNSYTRQAVIGDPRVRPGGIRSPPTRPSSPRRPGASRGMRRARCRA